MKVTIEFFGEYNPAERQTMNHPGCPEYMEWDNFDIKGGGTILQGALNDFLADLMSDRNALDKHVRREVEAHLLDEYKDEQGHREIDREAA